MQYTRPKPHLSLPSRIGSIDWNLPLPTGVGSIQLVVHLAAILIGVLFYDVGVLPEPITNSIPAFSITGQVIAHIFIALVCLPYRQHSVEYENDASPQKRAYNVAGYLQFLNHAVYFYLFMIRNVYSSVDPSDARPERAMEHEIDNLNNVVLRPMGIKEDSFELLQDMNSSMSLFDGTIIRNGEVLYWYQIGEGTVHAMIILGVILHVFKPTMRNSIFFFYEIGTVLEVIIYGPLYFWTISALWACVQIPSMCAVTQFKTFGVKFISTMLMSFHHTTYVIDSWSLLTIMKVWNGSSKRAKND